jgi:hypothetical protein
MCVCVCVSVDYNTSTVDYACKNKFLSEVNEHNE